jgi:LPPG:FO 2-phospho-L-lactate transferase
MICVLAGGVGAARFLDGLLAVSGDEPVVAIVNTGDDTELHGLTICPDLDTVTYTLAGENDCVRGWGLAGETWAAMHALERFASARPVGSGAGATWFSLGDRDLATHLYRSHRLAEGAPLTLVTAEIAAAFGLACTLLPMTDDPVRTRVTLAADGREIGFQEYFVGLRHDVAITGVRFAGIEAARPAPGVMRALGEARAVVIAPSNPIVSIGPILSLPGVAELLTERRDAVVAVSPIIAGQALKGPADRMLVELGLPASAVGVALRYRELCGTLVIDEQDAALAAEVDSVGVRAVVTDTIMRDTERAGHLARAVLDRAATA